MSCKRFRQKKHHRYKAISKSIRKRHCPRCKSGKDANDRMAEQIYPTALEKVFRSDLQIHDPSLAKQRQLCRRSCCGVYWIPVFV